MKRAWMTVLGAGLAAACGAASPDAGDEGAEALPSSVSQVKAAVGETRVSSGGGAHPEPAPWHPDTARASPGKPSPGTGHPEPAPWDETSSASPVMSASDHTTNSSAEAPVPSPSSSAAVPSP